MVRSILILFFFVLSFFSKSQLNFPEKPTDYVTDVVGLLSKSEKWKIDSLLGDFERKTGNQFFILIEDSLYGENLNTIGTSIYNKWGIGKKGKNNGVLLALFMKDRAYRFEVGYGLEGYLPDLETARIGGGYLIPDFKQQKYFEGLYRSVKAVIHRLKDERSAFLYEKLNLNTYEFLQDKSNVLSDQQEKVLKEKLNELSRQSYISFYIAIINDNGPYEFDELYRAFSAPHYSSYDDYYHNLLINSATGEFIIFDRKAD